jgi:transposase
MCCWLANTQAGLAALLACLAECGAGRPCRVVFEPTGRFHLALWRALHGAGHAAVPLNPYRARHFAEADAVLAKTDAIDARVLARACAFMDLPAAPPPAEDHLRIKELHGLRLSLVRALRAAKNQNGAARDALARRLLSERAAFLETQLAEIGAELAHLIEADPVLARCWPGGATSSLRSPASAPPSSPRSQQSCPSLATLTRRRSRHWPASPRWTAPVAHGKAGARPGAGGGACARLCTWRLWLRPGAIPTSRHAATASKPPENPQELS